MIDVCANQPQAEISRNTGQETPQHAKNAARHAPPPSADAVRRFERACEERDADTPTDAPDGADAMATAQCSLGVASAAGLSGNACSAQRGLHFAHAHEAPSREAAASADRKKDEGQRHSEDGSARNPLGMTHPLDGLFSSAPAAEAAPPQLADAPDVPDPPDVADAVWSTLAERILVANTPQGGQEVRITVGQDILPGTEISLTRHPDGGLTAVLTTDNAASLQTLVAGRDDLRQRLEHLGEGNVRVDVRAGTDGKGGNGGDGDTRQRSRGLVYPDPEAEA